MKTLEELIAEHERLGREIEALKAKKKPKRVFGVPDYKEDFYTPYHNGSTGVWEVQRWTNFNGMTKPAYLSAEAAEAEAELNNMIAQVRQYADTPVDWKKQWSMGMRDIGDVRFYVYSRIGVKLEHRFPWFNSREEAERHYTPEYRARARELLEIMMGVR